MKREPNPRKPMNPNCFILCVVRWPLLFSNLFVSCLTHCLTIRVSERDGLEGSFGIFGLRASLAGMPNAPESEGMVRVGVLIMSMFQVFQAFRGIFLPVILCQFSFYSHRPIV